MSNYLIAPSILSADFSKLGEEVKAVENGGADWLHFDVMDGHFVPNLTIGALVAESLAGKTKLPLDVHLMVEHPDDYVHGFSQAGAYAITIHAEAATHLHRSLSFIRESGVKAGVALNPATPLEHVEYVLELCDIVLVMTVNPGFGGQAFISEMLPKIERLRNLIDRKGLACLIEVDGGVSEHTITDIGRAGADVFVAGSAIFGQNDYGHAMRNMRKALEKI